MMGNMLKKLVCSRCQKRLWKKNARLINGAIVCAPCMFNQTPKDAA